MKLIPEMDQNLHDPRNLDPDANLSDRLFIEVVDADEFRQLLSNFSFDHDFIEEVGRETGLMRMLFESVVSIPETRGRWWKNIFSNVDALETLLNRGVWPVAMVDGILSVCKQMRPRLFRTLHHDHYLFFHAGTRHLDHIAKPVLISWRDADILDGSTQSLEKSLVIDRDGSSRLRVLKLQLHQMVHARKEFMSSEYLEMIRGVRPDFMLEMAKFSGGGFRILIVTCHPGRGDLEIFHHTPRLCGLLKKFARYYGDVQAVLMAKLAEGSSSRLLRILHGSLGKSSLQDLRESFDRWIPSAIPEDDPTPVQPFHLSSRFIHEVIDSFNTEAFVPPTHFFCPN